MSDADANTIREQAWVDQFVSTHRPELGPPTAAPLQPPPPLWECAPQHPAQDVPLSIFALEKRPSNPIRQAWQGEFQSRKLGRSVRWRSQLLFELYCHWELDPSITSYDWRRARLSLSADGKRGSLTPNAAIVQNGAVWFVIASWESALTDEKLARWRQFGEAAAASGHGFRIHTETDIRWQPRLRNVMAVTRAIPAGAADQAHRLLAATLLADGPLTFGELQRHSPLNQKTLMQLALEGTVRFDLDAQLTPGSPVWLVDGSGP